MTHIRPVDALRSMLFTPGNRPDLIAKAVVSGTDAVIVDLEDAVPVASKAQARADLANLEQRDVGLFVRVNGGETEFLWDDVVAAGQADISGILLPKAEDPDLIRQIDGALTALEIASGRPAGAITVLPMVESGLGILRLHDMLTSSSRIRVVLFSSGEQGDLVADLGCEWTPDGAGLLTARSLVVIAARAAGVLPMDAVFMDFRNLEGLRTECELARRVGYVGKVAIHPAQVAVIHDVFTPTDEQIAHHRRILEEFDRALEAGSASISVDGRMVDYAVARVARNVLARADIGRDSEQV
jgi:citrate lyase subunit beta/citryl-CoA lyase